MSLLVLLAAGLLAYACSDDGVDSVDRAAAEAINAEIQDVGAKGYIPPGTLLNVDKHKSDCRIGEGSTTGVDPMPAKCEWRARVDGTVPVVTFIETYKCSEFNERAGRDDFCPFEEASHQWEWAILEGEGVRFLGDSGGALAESFYLPSP
ncbi:MAG TPA: hypothetical protein VFP63_00630 [Dehalococcoidia bacterium]|nr:hypothetical protein [Dehalococcoidia bacterium]